MKPSSSRLARRKIRQVLAHVSAVSPGLAHRRALDFGCGVGRLARRWRGTSTEWTGWTSPSR